MRRELIPDTEFEAAHRVYEMASRPWTRPAAHQSSGVLVPRADHEFVVDGPCLVGQGRRRSFLELFEIPKTDDRRLRCVAGSEVG